ncbi:hypothetical protein NDU88_010126 [Pleurodeles waltl]|uniref:Secreted protein n=1 Tax=Pleurodeles waltl TaxID=8319 RepID=A0AAV7S312_PLEWA|nr:hypothetical protein NDU88_010126 [Pleurodeles waltl]
MTLVIHWFLGLKKVTRITIGLLICSREPPGLCPRDEPLILHGFLVQTVAPRLLPSVFNCLLCVRKRLSPALAVTQRTGSGTKCFSPQCFLGKEFLVNNGLANTEGRGKLPGRCSVQ